MSLEWELSYELTDIVIQRQLAALHLLHDGDTGEGIMDRRRGKRFPPSLALRGPHRIAVALVKQNAARLCDQDGCACNMLLTMTRFVIASRSAADGAPRQTPDAPHTAVRSAHDTAADGEHMAGL